MRRVTRWSAMALTVMGLVTAPMPATLAQQPTQSQLQNQINQAKNVQSDAKHKISALKQHIDQLNAKAAVLNVRLSNIEGQLSTTQTQIDQTVLQIQRRDHQISTTQAQIQTTKTKLQAQYQVLTNRLRIMYQAGHTSYLAVLFSATSFSDLLSRFHLLTLVAQQDRAVFEGIQIQERQLQRKQAQLNDMLQQQKAAYAILLQKQSTQSAQQQEEKRLLGQVQNETAVETADMNNEKNALADIGSKIRELQQQLGAFHATEPSGPWAWPVPGYNSISSGYGWRTLNGAPNFHPGIDIPAPIGTPIVASTEGRVLWAGPADGYGDWIVIDSGNGLLEIYGHMYSNELEVSSGQVVKRGQEIARVGDNGFSTGPHLHFEVATGIGSDGVPVSTDPTPYVGH